MPDQSRTKASRLRGLGRLLLVAFAALFGATVVSTGLLLYCSPVAGPPPVAIPATPEALDSSSASGQVHTEMRNVDYHVDADAVLRIRRLRGDLVPTAPNVPPAFEHRDSYAIRITSAEIAVDTTDLSLLLNRYFFGYPGSPLRDLRVAVEGNELVQRGKLGALSFKIRSTAAVTPEGRFASTPPASRSWESRWVG